MQQGLRETGIINKVSNSSLSKEMLRVNLPTWPDGKDDVALLRASFHEGHASVFLPVTHGLLENGSLAACRAFDLNQ